MFEIIEFKPVFSLYKTIDSMYEIGRMIDISAVELNICQTIIDFIIANNFNTGRVVYNDDFNEELDNQTYYFRCDSTVIYMITEDLRTRENINIEYPEDTLRIWSTILVMQNV